MKKIYLLAGAALIASTGFSQKSTTRTQAYLNKAKKATITNTKSKPSNNESKGIAVLEENFDSGNAFPNGWTVQSGPSSTITVADQTWHEGLGNNSSLGANVSYDNSADFHDEWLISPNVTLPTTTDLLVIDFDFYSSPYWHVTPFDNVDIFLKISTDGGASWSDLWTENPVTFEFQVWTPQRVELTAYQGQNVSFAFQYLGQDGAFFNLDNIYIGTITGVDLVQQGAYWNFGGNGSPIISYTQIPQKQLATVYPSVIATNNGGSGATNVIASVTGSGAGSYSGTTNTIGLAVGASDTLADGTGFTPSALGVYNILMSLSSDVTDEDLSDNSAILEFEVTDATYARDNGDLEGWYGSDDDDGDGLVDPVAFQQDFEIHALDTVYGLNVVFPDVQAWEEMEIYYNIYDGAGNPLYDGTTSPTPVKTIYPSDLSPSDGTGNVWVSFPFETAGEPGLELDPANGNMFTVEISHDIDSLFIASSGDGYANPGVWTTAGITFNGLVAQTGYYITNNLMIRMDMTEPVTTGVEELVLVSNMQNVPNPFNHSSKVNYTLDKGGNVEFMISDLSGKVLEKRNLGTTVAGNHSINIDGNSLASGLYYYSLIVNGKVTTKKMSVIK